MSTSHEWCIRIWKWRINISWREQNVSWDPRFSMSDSIYVLHKAMLFKHLFTYVWLNSDVRSFNYMHCMAELMNNQLERIWKWMLPNVRYNPNICLQRMRFNNWITHIQHTSQKQCMNQLAWFLSVKWTYILTCIHKSCIWMACCPDVCSECAH
jgi:hypothetical protein